MGEPCPHLSLERTDGERSFDTDRPFCTIESTFVQPMRADICRARYSLRPERDCEIYRDDHEQR